MSVCVDQVIDLHALQNTDGASYAGLSYWCVSLWTVRGECSRIAIDRHIDTVAHS